MSTNYTTYAGHANATITVSTTAELNAALNNLGSSGGGTILLDGNGGPFDISGNNIGDANNPILIKAVDPSNLPVVESISLTNASHITMTELHVDSSGSSANNLYDIDIKWSDNIEIVGNTMTSVADGYLGSNSTVTAGANLSIVADSQSIVFSDNYIADYGRGATFTNVDGFDFSNNEMTGIQMDGVHGTGWKDVTITNNYMHDFYGSTNDINHDDFIQIWSANATIVTQNVEISGNILDTGSGAAYQGIWISSQNLGESGAAGQYFQDIKIFDNVVHTGLWNGIALGSTTGGEIYDNTVLFNSASYFQQTGNSPSIQGEPRIITTNSPNAQVFDNVAGNIILGDGSNPSTNNYILSYTNPSSPAYVDNHITNLSGQGSVTIDDLSFLASSPLYGTQGAYYSTVGGTWDSAGGTWQPTPTPPTTPTTPAPTVPDDTTNTDPDDTSTTDPDDTATTVPDDTPATKPDDTSAPSDGQGGGNANSNEITSVLNNAMNLLVQKFGNSNTQQDSAGFSENSEISTTAQIDHLLSPNESLDQNMTVPLDEDEEDDLFAESMLV